MSHTILLYGATGYTGRLIAAEAAQRWSAPGASCRLVLGARSSVKLRDLARRHGVDYRSFALDHRDSVLRGLAGVAVVINAAGPFALTAERLAKAALEVGCHYVDINGEVDVYKRLDDLGRFAAQRGVAIVCSAGHMSAVSDLLFDSALAHLQKNGIRELGAVRFAMSRILPVSRGSAYSALRSLREQVTVVREGNAARDAKRMRQPVLWHVPVGRLERTFDFGFTDKPRRIAAAANLVDTLTARVEAMRYRARVQGIESYIEMSAAGRISYQIGAMGSPLLVLPWIGTLAGSQLSLLPEGPTTEEREASPHVILLEIEDILRTRVIDWRLEGPNIYDVTAEAVTRIAEHIAEGDLYGWRTPAEALGARLNLGQVEQNVPSRGSRLEQRITVG